MSVQRRDHRAYVVIIVEGRGADEVRRVSETDKEASSTFRRNNILEAITISDIWSGMQLSAEQIGGLQFVQNTWRSLGRDVEIWL